MKKNRDHQHLVEIDGWGLRGSHWLGSVIIPIFWTSCTSYGGHDFDDKAVIQTSIGTEINGTILLLLQIPCQSFGVRVTMVAIFSLFQ